MVSRYTDPVELSWTILLVLMLEILSVILPTAAMSVEVPQPSHVRLWHSHVGHNVSKTSGAG